MLCKEDVKKLIESINVGKMNESEMDVLVEDTLKKLNESFDESFQKGREAGKAEVTESLRKERLESFQRGLAKGTQKVEAAINESEKIAFNAGHEQAIHEAEEKEAEVSKELLDLIEQLCIVFDKYTRLVEIATTESSKEFFKESVKNALIDFCDRKVNESFPKEVIVDYHRMQKLESVLESVKKVALITDADVSEAVEKAKESCAKEFTEAKQLAEDQTKKRIAAEQMLESVKAENYLLKKVQSLPVSDQKSLMESFKGASIESIDESFDREKQRLIERHQASVIQKPVVADVICESRIQKLRESRARKIEESAKTEKDGQKQQVNESAQQTAANPVMDAYVSNCKMLQRQGL